MVDSLYTVPELRDQTLYTLHVLIPEMSVRQEPAWADFLGARTVEVLGVQTLWQLHESLLRAFGRWEDWGELPRDDRPHNDGSVRHGYRSPFGPPDPFDAGNPIGDAAKTTVSALGLEAEQWFGYWFDLWDDWHYEIYVVAISEAESGVEYPRAIRFVGRSPQYQLLAAGWGEEVEVQRHQTLRAAR